MKNIKEFIILLLLLSLAFNSNSQSLAKPITQNELEYYLSKSVVAREVNELLKTSDGYYKGKRVVDSAELIFWQTYGDKWEILSGKEVQIYEDMIRLIGSCGTKYVFDVGAWTMPYNYEIHLYSKRDKFSHH